MSLLRNCWSSSPQGMAKEPPRGALELPSVPRWEGLLQVTQTRPLPFSLLVTHKCMLGVTRGFEMYNDVFDLKASRMVSPVRLCLRNFSILIFSIGNAKGQPS